MTMILTVASRKGGTCKTTTSVHLAGCMANLGKSVIMIDLDGQANASEWVLNESPKGSLSDAIHNGDPLASLLCASIHPNIQVIPADDDLDLLDRRMAGLWGAEKRLKKAVATLDADVIIFDCPAAFDLRTVSALLASDWVLIPTEVSALALGGLMQFIPKVLHFQDEDFNPNLQLLGVLLCRAKRNTVLHRDVRELLGEHLGDVLLESEVRESIRYRECPSHHEFIMDYAPDLGQDYRDVTAEILRRSQA